MPLQQITARQAIDAARDFHPAFDLRSTPDTVALRRLAQYQQELLAEIVEFKLDLLHVAQVIPLPLAGFADGVQLDPYLRVHGGSVQYTDTSRRDQPLTLVEYPLRLDELAADWQPVGYLRAGRLLLNGVADDWSDITSVTVDVFPKGPDTLALKTALVLPGSPLRACAADLAALMAVRADTKGISPESARRSYLDEVTERRRAKVGTVREVW